MIRARLSIRTNRLPGLEDGSLQKPDPAYIVAEPMTRCFYQMIMHALQESRT